MTDYRLHILLCDDDINLTTMLADYLRANGHEVATVANGDECLAKLVSFRPDVCLLDLNMPQKDGFETLEAIREMYAWLPVIVISGRTAQEDIVRAFKLGADDYMTKPLAIEILKCRIEALMRRSRVNEQHKETTFDLNGVHFDAIRQTLGEEHLPARENELLLMLCRNMNTLVDRHFILRSIWRDDNYFVSKSLSVYMNHLRHRLANTGYSILGVHGRGYKLIHPIETKK